MTGKETFKHIFIWDLKRIWNNKSYLFNSLVFYIMCIALFNIAIGPYELSYNTKIALLYTPLILGMLLSTSLLYEKDIENGILHQLILLPVAFEYVILARFCAYCISFIASIILILPASCLILNLPYSSLPIFYLTGFLLIVLTSAILFLSTAMITNTSFNSFMPILVLPLLIPGVILATMAAQNMQYIWILLAITILNLPISLFFTRLVLTDVIKYDS